MNEIVKASKRQQEDLKLCSLDYECDVLTVMPPHLKKDEWSRKNYGSGKDNRSGKGNRSRQDKGSG